jgi:hypothetical protein
VTASPLFKSEKTASRPPASFAGVGAGALSNFRGGGGGPGGGGGGGPPPEASGCGRGALGCAPSTVFIASSVETPLGFQGRP